jgi:thiamine-phosphate pyrophosphorylase
MIKAISHFHFITQDVAGTDHPSLALRACEAGVDWVQLRVKKKSWNEWLDIALKTEFVCRNHNSILIINDNPLIAKAVKADGVHLGKEDMTPREARELLGSAAIIGGTANTIEDVERLAEEGVDYIGAGPFRFTNTKENLSPVLGLQGYEAILDHCRKNKISIPIIAIGGIKTEDVKPLMQKGIYGIAVSSAVNLAEDPSAAIRKFRNKIKFEKENHPQEK